MSQLGILRTRKFRSLKADVWCKNVFFFLLKTTSNMCIDWKVELIEVDINSFSRIGL